MRNLTYHSFDYVYTEDARKQNIEGVVNKLLGLDEKLVIESTVTNTDSDYDVYVVHTDNPNYALRFSIDGSVYTSSLVYTIYVRLYCKSASGDWTFVRAIVDNRSFPSYNLNSSYCGVRIEAATWNNGISIRWLGLTKYGAELLGGADGSKVALFPLVDSFNSAQRGGVFCEVGEDVLDTFVGCTNDGVSHDVTRLIMGGEDYPSRNMYVASPIILHNTSADFYGYAVDSLFLYAIFRGSSRFDMGYKSEVIIDGNKFAQVIGNYYTLVGQEG